MASPRTLVLDTFPVSSTSLLLPPPAVMPTVAEACYQCVLACLAAGNRVIVPAVCYYESLRELERRGASGKIYRLRQFCFSASDRFLPLETAHLEKAAELWAQARNAGIPTASPDALDGDVILAARTLSLGLPASDFVVATTNVAHLSRFVPADDWQTIAPGS